MLMDMLLGNSGYAVSHETARQLGTVWAEILRNRLATKELGPYSHLLVWAMSRQSDSDWQRTQINLLVPAIAEAVVGTPIDTVTANAKNNLSELLSLLVQLIEQHPQYTLESLAGLPNLRQLTRNVIKLLSVPSPLIAAPALHLLTLVILLPPYASLSLRPLEAIVAGGGLRAKLFDGQHIHRTLELIADLCLNCQSPLLNEKTSNDGCLGLEYGKGMKFVNTDMQVLDAVAGIVDAMSSVLKQEDPARTAFYESQELVAAIEHLCSLSAMDRRYIFPLLRMVNSIISGVSTEDLKSPLIQVLYQRHASSIPSPAGSNGSVSETSTCGNTSSVMSEILDMVVSGIEDTAYTVPGFESSGNEQQPRVSSEESGCGWFINCPTSLQRQVVVEFLAIMLDQQDNDDGNVAQDLAMVILHVLTTILPLPEDGMLFGDKDDGAVAKLGGYYWAVRPVLTLCCKLCKLQPGFAKCWSGHLAGCNDGKLAKSTSRICRSLADPSVSTMLEDIQDELMADDSGAYPAVLRQWMHICKVELAILLCGRNETAHLMDTHVLSVQRTLSPVTMLSPTGDPVSYYPLADIVSGMTKLHQAHTERCAQASRDLEEAKRDYQRMEEDNKDLLAEYERHERDIDDLEKANKDWETKHGLMKEVASQWEQKYNAACKELDGLEEFGMETRAQLSKANKENHQLQMSLDNKDAQMAKEVGKLETALTDAVARLRGLETQLENGQRERESLTTQKAELSAKLAEFTRIADSLHKLAHL